MSPCQGFIELELATAGDDVFLMVKIVVQNLFERQDARMAVDEGQHDDAERFLKLRVLVQLVQDDIRVDIGPQFDDDAHALAVRFIAQGRNTVDFLIAGQVGNGLDDARFIDLIRDFRHDNAVFPLVHRFDSRTGPHLDAAPAGRIGFDDAVAAHDLSARREIRPFDFSHDFFQAGFGVVDEQDAAVDDFA